MSTFDALVADLTRDAYRVQPKDALQFCANWFQSRLEEQRTHFRDVVSQQRRSLSHDLPTDHYWDSPMTGSSGPGPSSSYQHLPSQRTSLRNSIAPSPFGTLDVPGNALLQDDTPRNSTGMIPTPTLRVNDQAVSPLTTTGHYPAFHQGSLFSDDNNNAPENYLQTFSSTILARRTSVSAEPLSIESESNEPLPTFPKTPEQLRRIKASISSNLMFRDLDEEQQTGALNAMQELQVPQDEVIIRQGDVGQYFYVVESGLFHVYVREDTAPLAPSWYNSENTRTPPSVPSTSVVLPNGNHSEFGKKVAECGPGKHFGEVALMYGHARTATVVAMEPSVVWSLDRITFRTIILKAAYRRRTMYENFLAMVPLLSSLSAEERSKVADALVSRVYQDGEPVVTQGEMGDTFFFVEDGEATVVKTTQGESGEMNEITVGTLTKGDYFGELSLLRFAPRAATVSAIYRADPSMPKLKVAALDAHAFTRLLGPLREMMERNAGESYGPSYKFPG